MQSELNELYDKDIQVTKLWDMYQDGIAYQNSSGISKNIPTFVKFFEGNQWPAPTKNTKNLPRPVINIIKMICRNKKSAILSTPVKIIYRAEDETVDTTKFNNFAEYIQREIGQEVLDKRAIDDGVKKGSYFFHYYWDKEAKGKDGVKEGGLRCDVIDILNIFFSNPTETDEQKQKWILLASREDVDSIKAKCDPDVDKDLITSDESEYNRYGTIEQEGNKLCTILTRYFRKDGEVYCEKATKTTIINKPFSITPDLDKARQVLGFNEEDAPNNNLPDTQNSENLVPNKTQATLYPIVAGQYEPKEGSIYGLSEVEGLIPNQKSINFNIAMQLKNIEDVAWGKYTVLPNALKGQQITNEPGQVLIDHSQTGNGIKKMTEQPISNAAINIVDTITQLTRVVTGTSEVMTGETIGANMSGAAIAQLQGQAQQPIDELKDTFWLVKEKQGKVLAQFFKLYYEDKEFTYTDVQETFDENTGKFSQKEVLTPDRFNSADYANTELNIVVEAISGTKSSAAGDINALDSLISKGLISIKTYLKSYPKDALSNRTEIIKGIEEDEQGEMTQLKQQVAQYEQQLEQAIKLVQQQKETVDKVVSLIQENNQLKAFIANLYSEAKGKINQSNEQINLANRKIQETTQDATEFAQFIAQMQASPK